MYILYLILLSLMTNLRHCLRKKTWHKCRFQFVFGWRGPTSGPQREWGLNSPRWGVPLKELTNLCQPTYTESVKVKINFKLQEIREGGRGIPAIQIVGPHPAAAANKGPAGLLLPNNHIQEAQLLSSVEELWKPKGKDPIAGRFHKPSMQTTHSCNLKPTRGVSRIQLNIWSSCNGVPTYLSPKVKQEGGILEESANGVPTHFLERTVACG